MARNTQYHPDIQSNYGTEEGPFGGVTVSPDDVVSNKQTLAKLHTRSDIELEQKRTHYKEGEILVVEGVLETGEELCGTYVVVETGRSRKRHSQKEFHVLAEVTGDHKIVAHNSGEAYQIPVDTQYPCTHRDVPEDDLISFNYQSESRYASPEYTEKQLETAWLARQFDLEADIVVEHI